MSGSRSTICPLPRAGGSMSAVTSVALVMSDAMPSPNSRCVPALDALVTGPGTAPTGRPSCAARAATLREPER